MSLQHLNQFDRHTLFVTAPHGTPTFPIGDWVIDPSATTVRILVPTLLFKQVSLVLFVRQGTASVGSAGDVCRLDVLLCCESLDSGSPRLDRHLQSAAFLDAKRFPGIRFRGSATGDALSGRLEIKEHTVPIQLTMTDASPSPDGAVTFAAHGSINRRDIGLSKRSTFVIGNELAVTVRGRAHPA